MHQVMSSSVFNLRAISWFLLSFLSIFISNVPTSQGGYAKYQSCSDLWQEHKIRASGTYLIDVDGVDGPLRPVWLDCDMGNGNDLHQVLTIIHHESEEPSNVRGMEAPGSFARNISYRGLTEAHLEVVINSSFSCQQFIKWACKGSMFGFWYPPDLDSWWVGRNWQNQYYWGGAETDSRTCGCYPYCYPTPRNSTCNCDANVKLAWLEDSGLLLDSTRLPVLQLRFGDTGESNEAGQYTLGPLVCRVSGHKDVFKGHLPAPATITSPYYPQYPPPFHRYTWKVKIPEGEIMELVFKEYDVLHWGAYNSVPGCKYVVTVLAEMKNGQTVVIQRQRSAPPYFISDGQETIVTLTFVTCNQIKELLTEKGFIAEFRRAECPSCEAGLGKNGGITSCSSKCGVIASYGYPFPHHMYDEPHDYNHTWIIRVPYNHIVALYFNDFDIKTIPGSHICSPERGVLKVYSGENINDKMYHGEGIIESNLIGSFCDINRRGVVYSTTNSITLVLSTRWRRVGNGRGFHATYRIADKASLPKPVNYSSLKNVAEGKPAEQSSTVNGYTANLAVDGNTSGRTRGGSCIKTEFEKEPWWRVNLQKRHLIYGIEIYNKADKQFQFSNSPHFPTWPAGQYGLPMPISGCPSSYAFTWRKGVRYHDVTYDILQDDRVRYWSAGMLLAGGLQERGGVEQHFCIKGDDAVPRNSSYQWMPGRYCIFQYGDKCPEGFQSGSIIWVDKNSTEEHSQSYVIGAMPKGIYTAHNTTIYFCCREDGNPDVPIQLPTDRPFYLFQFGDECQKVEGMSELEQFFHYEEGAPLWGISLELIFVGGVLKFQDPHPRVDIALFDRGLTLHYCYYDVTDSLRGFRVLVDDTGLITTYNKYYDDKNYGIAHTAEGNFLNAHTCVDYPVTNKEFSVLHVNCTQPMYGQYIAVQIYNRYEQLQFCEIKVFGEEACGQPLGMATEEIYDSQISATSSDDHIQHYYTNARLNANEGWCASTIDKYKLLQINLGNITTITGVALQGMTHSFKDAYVHKFSLKFSNDSSTWIREEEPVGQSKIYDCKQCDSRRYRGETVYYHLLKSIKARYLRIYIIEFKNYPCMRVEVLGCRDQVVCRTDVTEPEGSVMSPNYPYYYGQDKSCWWNIDPTVESPEGNEKHVELNFIVYDLAQKENNELAGNCRDELVIYPDGNSNQTIKSPDGKMFPKKIISKGVMRIHLDTCFRYSPTRYQGFYATYKFVDCPGCGIGDFQCSDVHVCNSTCGQILSIAHPLNYLNNYRCRWLIRAPPSYYINVTFHEFDVVGGPNCIFDYVDFYDGVTATRDNLIGRFCNDVRPPKYLLSSWNELMIEFYSDAEGSGRGFYMTYRAQRFQLPVQLQDLKFDDPRACPSLQWKHYNNHCYRAFFETDVLQWYEAESRCAEEGKGRDGHLVSILDEKEMAVVHHLLIDVWKAHRKALYIGLIDVSKEGVYRWSDGNPMSYTDWALASKGVDAQPDGGAYEDCTILRVDSGHSTANWHDIPCSLGKHALSNSSGVVWSTDKKRGKNDVPDTISSYICKMKADTGYNEIRQPLYKQQPPPTSLHIPRERYFVCHNKEVISVLFICDGKPDCRDGSDEASCEKPCPKSSFRCSNGRCVSIAAYCNFQNECGDGSDEINCEHRKCRPGEFRCGNDECIHMSLRCDLLPHCQDGSDEVGCGGHCNPNSTFQCYYGTCIPLYAVCDRHRDCPGKFHEDEQAGCSREEDRVGILAENNRCDMKARRTCEDLYMHDHIRSSGFYFIDPDGSNGPLLPFMVECIVGDSNETVKTIIHHDSEARIYVRSGSDGPGSYSRPIVYNIGMQQIQALINISKFCRQYISWECSGTGFLFKTRKPVSWWVDRNGKPQYIWGDAVRNLTCGCYPYCVQMDLECNCDAAARFQWQEDAGFLKDKDKLPITKVFFGNTFGTGQAGYHTIGPLECFGQTVEFANTCNRSDTYIHCQSGQYVKADVRCLYEFDQYGYQKGCRDVTHLRGCEDFECPDGYMKCPNSYCIPVHYLCDGKWDCIGGYDEVDCDPKKYSCPGQYKCHNESYCILLDHLCDGVRHCSLGDDEWFCDLVCPPGCKCIGLYVSCNHQNMTKIPSIMPKNVRKLDFSHNRLYLKSADFSTFTNLGELILRHNELTTVPSKKFPQLRNLYRLDLRNNKLRVIESAAFAGLRNLVILQLENNPTLEEIEPEAFVGLTSLTSLNLSNTKVTHLRRNAFWGLSKLKVLNLRNNMLEVVDNGAFQNLDSLNILDIRENDITHFSQQIFNGMKSLEYLYSDSFKFCCLASSQIPFENCWPPPDEISSCEDLMSSALQRSFLWVLGIIAFLGNLFVIVWRIKTRESNRVSSTLILSLGCADFLMGIYLLIIASVDVYYRGRYIENSDLWRKSTLCKACGFLSTLSSEASVFTLVFITLDRLICICFPFNLHRFSIRLTYRLIIMSWTVAALLASLPLVIVPYFKGEFYARSGVCLALHITNQKPAGWEYSVAVFFCVNLVAFLMIVGAYTYMYLTIRKSHNTMNRLMPATQAKESQVGRQMAVVVLTNFLCWFPVICMGLMAMAGAKIPGEAYAWVAVFVLPLNSATNPLVYTIASLQFQLVLARFSFFQRNRRDSLTLKKYNYSLNSSSNGIRSRDPLQRRPFKPPHGYISLPHYLRSCQSLNARQLLKIALSICLTMKDLHANGYALGGINMDTVFVSAPGSSEFHVYLPDFTAYKICHAPGSDIPDDTAIDIEEFGLLVKKMLRMYHVSSRGHDSYK